MAIGVGTSNAEVQASLGPRKQTALAQAPDAFDAELGETEVMGAFGAAGAN